ncbi:ATPase [Clostridiales bacterium PH28_bin88]|nr:ATPase [Clostridiales bacterium PH28_bin88]
MLKETLLGIGTAVFLFLMVLGYDLTPFLLLGGIGFFLYFLLEKKGALPGNLANPYLPTQKVTFDDIGGQASPKQELREALDFVVKADMVSSMGIRPLKGILLTGPPGTGKTLLARAAATYTEATFLACTGSEFIEMYAGVGAQRVRSLFKRARDLAVKAGKNRAVVFIDEIEVLGGKRGAHTGHLEYDQTLNQLLVEMDGIKGNDQVRVLVIGATNRADMLDPALLRPGRFDRQVKVDLPDKTGRMQILQLHMRNKPQGPDVDLESIARETFGFSGAHLESVTNEAAILAMRDGKEQITMGHLKEAVDKVMLGEKLDRIPSPEEVYRVAVHESGHGVISELLQPNSVSHITVAPRGNALGYVRQVPPEDRYLYTLKCLEKQICICLAGSVAEEMLLGDKSTGSTGDFQEAVRLAKRIVFAGLSDAGVISEEDVSKEELNREVKTIIKKLQGSVAERLGPYRDTLEAIARQLVTEEYLSGETLRDMLNLEEHCA